MENNFDKELFLSILKKYSDARGGRYFTVKELEKAKKKYNKLIKKQKNVHEKHEHSV